MSNVGKVSDHYLGDSGRSYVQARQSLTRSEHGYELNLAWFMPYLRKTDRVLDFGAGTGGMLRVMKGNVAHADGLEVNPAAAKLAREQSGCQIFESIDSLPTGTLYDAVTSNHVLEHVRDVCSTLEQLRRHIKPGGLLIVKLPIDDARDSHQSQWSKNDVDYHLQTWTPRSFANVLFESGFEVQECRAVTSSWHTRLFWLRRFGLEELAFRAYAWWKRRRQLFAVAVNPPHSPLLPSPSSASSPSAG